MDDRILRLIRASRRGQSEETQAVLTEVARRLENFEHLAPEFARKRPAPRALYPAGYARMTEGMLASAGFLEE